MLNKISRDSTLQYSMTALKLKTNILELVCRICLKMDKICFNIFEHLQNEKHVSTMLMDCLPMTVQENDGFPAKICSNCLDQLCSAYNFKTMAMQSNTKLHSFYQNKVLESERDGSVCIKEEETVLISEKIDSPFNLAEKINYNIKKLLSDEQNGNKNIEENNSVTLLGPQSKSQNNIYVNLQQTHNIKQQSALLVSSISNTLINSKLVDKCCKHIDQAEHIQECSIETCSALRLENVTHNSIVDVSDMLPENKSTSQLSSSSDDLDCSSICSDTSDGHKSKNIIIEAESGPKNKKKRGNPVNCNEREDEFVNTLDCNRIISGQSKEENKLISIHEDKKSDFVVHDVDLPQPKIDKRRKSIFCKDCNRSFAYSYYFKVHIRHHTGDKPFKCDICGKVFAAKCQLKSHVVIHSDNRPYSCDVCGKCFKNLPGIISHKKVHSEEKNFKCEQCGKTLKSENSLKGHILRHQNDKHFVCEICGKGFVESSDLISHKVCHRTEKNYICSTCGKKFVSKSHLRVHSRRHSDDRPYACSHCDRRFKDKTVLRNHVLIHTGEKPFTCKICSKQFRQGNVLTLHMRTHTGETPYPCNLCPCKFKYSHHLRNHMKVHK